jgi:hypothetical protein
MILPRKRGTGNQGVQMKEWQDNNITNEENVNKQR